MRITNRIKILFLALLLITVSQMAWAKTINLANCKADTQYDISNGDVLTGTLSVYARIVIKAGATVTLDGIDINVTLNKSNGAIPGIYCAGDATLILKDGTTNKVKGFSSNNAGIYVPSGKTLTIQGGTAGTGSLLAYGGSNAAGIGGGSSSASSSYRSCGNIVIKGGHITATGGNGAGIGAGAWTTAGNITISGGVVTASSTGVGAGIGTGTGYQNGNKNLSSCGNIVISGGTVTATGGSNAAGIGSAQAATCGTITISGMAIVTATKGSGASHSIGKGAGANCGTVTVNGTAGFISTSPYTYTPVGKYIRLGAYSGEYVDWLIVKSNSNGFMMLSKYVLKNMTFGPNQVYTQSNIYKWLDADGGGTFEDDLGLTATERSLVKTVNLSGSNGDGTDRFIIPTRGEELPNGSPYTKAYYIYNKSSLCGAFWLREIRGTNEVRVVRSSDETVTARYSNVGNSNGVRPMFYLNTEALANLTSTGSGTEADPYVFQTRYDVALDMVPTTGATVSATVTRGGQPLFTANLPVKTIAGDVVTLTVTPNNSYTLKGITVTSGSNPVSTTGEGNTRTFTVPAGNVSVKVALSLPTDGSGAYLIRSVADWDLFCSEVTSGTTFSGQTVKMTANVNGATTMAGTNETNSFQGTFDGQSHTLNVNVTDAPLRSVKNANIRNLVVTGSITNSENHIAGMLRATYGDILIENCEVAASISGAKYMGGFIGHSLSANITLKGCVFSGTLSPTGSNNIGGFIGWGGNGAHTFIISDCLFNGTVTGSATSKFHPVGCYSNPTQQTRTITNTYYTISPKNMDEDNDNNSFVKGLDANSKGKQAYASASDPGDMGDLVKDYGLLKAYVHGILFNGKYYVAGTSISLVAANIFGESKYVGTFFNGTKDYQIIENAKAYTMSLDGGNVVFHQIGEDGLVIPHQTAVVIVASESIIDLRSLNSTSVEPHEGNILRGSDTDVAVTAGKVDGKTPYVLNISGSVLGFYKFTGSSIPAGKAYYLVTE